MKLKLWRSLLLGLCLSNAIVYAALRSAPQVTAQISPDGTTDTTVNSTDNGIRIDEGDRAGNNLFHSFQEFSVPDGSEAFFNNPEDIINIFSRVTGGNISNIEGLLQANGDANLFLINPAGIIFGEGAALDIGGSFVATTAESIIFSDDVKFSATDGDNPPLLTINRPLGLNFGNNIGDISVDGSFLQAGDGATIALLGGNISLDRGQVIMPGGKIELGSLSQAERVDLVISDSEIAINAASFVPDLNRGNIILTNGSNLSVQAEGGGNIAVYSGNLQLSAGESGSSFISGGIISEATSSDAQAGDVVIDVTNDIVLTQGSSILNTVDKSTVGNAGNIKIDTTNLTMQDGGAISASNFGLGNAGAIRIDATGNIIADGESSLGFVSGIFSLIDESVAGNAGGINITAKNISLTNGGEIIASNLGGGDTGEITINATGDITADGESNSESISGIFSTIEESIRGNSAGIAIAAENIFLTNGGQISASNFGGGDAGEVTINATGDITADGESSTSSASGIFSLIDESVTGNGGGINITAKNLTLTNGGEVSASTAGIGNAGSIAIATTGDIFAAGRSSLGFASGVFNTVEETGEGNAGGIEITANNLSLADGGQISVASFGLGNAGSLQIEVSSLNLKDGGFLFASTPTGRGGNIDLEIANNLTLENRSQISAQALENASGGNIEIDADFIIAQPNQNNNITASAAEGTGGNIGITTNAIFGLEERSSIPDNNTNNLDASSELGVDGTIQINELEVNPTQGLEELPLEIIDVIGSVEQNLCQQGQGSEFVVTGKGGTAPSPTQARDGSVSEVDLVKPVPFSEVEAATPAPASEESSEIVEAQGWIVNDRGMVELVARKTDVDSSTAPPKSIQVCHQQ